LDFFLEVFLGEALFVGTNKLLHIDTQRLAIQMKRGLV